MQPASHVPGCAEVMQTQFLRVPIEEPKLKLSLETRESGEVTVVYCRGRVVYRDEAAALSRKVSELFPGARRLVLELSGVESIDSAGLGGLVSVFQAAQASGAAVSLVAPSKRVHTLLRLTNLTSLFEVYPSLPEALVGWEQPA
jgi:anti-anti-sigma factor